MEGTPDFKAIAAQLRQPSGDDGIATAERMSDNNGNMIRRCIDHLNIQDKNRVLEMGPGGGTHLPYVLPKAKDIYYQGIDISATMVALASSLNQPAIESGQAAFLAIDPVDGYVRIPGDDRQYDRIFTVNTLYFWDNAPAQAAELFRVLRPGGVFALCFATEAFMKTLPFTEFGFNLYSPEKATDLLAAAGFHIVDVISETEQVTSNAGHTVEREFIVLLASRDIAS